MEKPQKSRTRYFRRKSKKKEDKLPLILEENDGSTADPTASEVKSWVTVEEDLCSDVKNLTLNTDENSDMPKNTHQRTRPNNVTSGVLGSDDYRRICNPYGSILSQPSLIAETQRRVEGPSSPTSKYEAVTEDVDIEIIQQPENSDFVPTSSEKKKKKKRAKRMVKKTGKTVWRGLRGGWKLFWSGMMLFSAPLTSMDVSTTINRAVYTRAQQQQQQQQKQDEYYHDYNSRRPRTDYTQYDKMASRW